MKTHKVVNLIYDSVSHKGTEAECWAWVNQNYGSSKAALLLDVRPLSDDEYAHEADAANDANLRRVC